MSTRTPTRVPAPQDTTGQADAATLRAGTIDLPDPNRPPHPGGRPCGGLCVPACAELRWTHGSEVHAR